MGKNEQIYIQIIALYNNVDQREATLTITYETVNLKVEHN
jgi:hypothetical protein